MDGGAGSGIGIRNGEDRMNVGQNHGGGMDRKEGLKHDGFNAGVRGAGSGANAEGHHAREGPQSRAPVYILAGNAGAGFTHGFPNPLPEWVMAAFQVSYGLAF